MVPPRKSRAKIIVSAAAAVATASRKLHCASQTESSVSAKVVTVKTAAGNLMLASSIIKTVEKNSDFILLSEDIWKILKSPCKEKVFLSFEMPFSLQEIN